MIPRSIQFPIFAASCFLRLAPPTILATDDPAQLTFFEEKIRPILVENCYECHSEKSKKVKGGLRLDSRAGLLRGGETTPPIVPGDASKSLLIESVNYQNRDLQMPPKKRLSERMIADLSTWINNGAFDPRVGPAIPSSPPEKNPAKPHWAFQPIHPSTPPANSHPVDHFITEKLATHGLKMSPPADRRTLIRRAAYDLTGLPPTPAEITQFLEDDAPDAFAQMIDRFLASPRYGERWGRWWLDIARYADTNGQDENKVMANAWRYRDWVIRAFNSNQPFNDFLTEQLAGDLLPTEALSPTAISDRWIATGFLVLGPKILAEQDKPKLLMDLIDEQIDTVSRAFLGLTVSCARCHDHKFDPIPTRDYYALAGIFRSTKTMGHLEFVSKCNEREITTPTEQATIQTQTAQLAQSNHQLLVALTQADLSLLTNWRNPPPIRFPDFLSSPLETFSLPKNLRPRYPIATQAHIASLEKQCDALKHQRLARQFALAVEDDKPIDLPIHLRGSHLNVEKLSVPRGFLSAIQQNSPSPLPTNHSGRLELAHWLTHPDHPLTSRVIVNRVWQAHFGDGLVRSSDNFGLRGESPSHPELLDWLASEFLRSGWNLQHLHRLILTSAAWQQSTTNQPPPPIENLPTSTTAPPTNLASTVDPDNRLLSHFPRQRLEAEMIRDALLAVSGRLDLTLGGSLVTWKNDEYVPKDFTSTSSFRRSIYLPVVRGRVFDLLAIFDTANPSVSTARRIPTVVTHQALYFLNSPLVIDAAQSFAKSLLTSIDPAQPNPSNQVTQAYERAFARLPTPHETQQAIQFINTLSTKNIPDAQLAAWSAWCQVLFASSEFIYRE